ncbi:YdcF family protein [Larkinella harenae]
MKPMGKERTGMPESIYQWALTLWNYHHLNHELVKSDAILVLCSHDLRVAQRGAALFLEGWAPLLIFSGGLGVITKHMWSEPEADQFARIALDMGVPAQQILIENQSSNTGENVLFTRQLLEQRKLELERFIVVQKPYMERRSFATFKKVWPQKEVIVTSPQDTFEEYLSQYNRPDLTPDDMISIMVGDLQRIQLYPQKGFQIPQAIPTEVWAAYEALVQAGYDRHLASS